MKKWFKFFCFSFFSHKIAKDAVRRGYTNVFLSFVLALAFLWAAFIGGDMLPFGPHYSNSSNFVATVHDLLASNDADKRIDVEIRDGVLMARRQGGEYSNCLLVNTMENETDRQAYSTYGYDVVIDLRPADTPAEVYAYCVSNGEDKTEISYQDYLSLNQVARLNFDFKLRYTGRALILDDKAVRGYLAYLNDLGQEVKSKVDGLASQLGEGKITGEEYNRAIYELYFVNYYPEISAYESASKIPLLRNYYYHEYISQGIDNYLFIFDDYLAASFKTRGGADYSFYGFFGNLEDGRLIGEGVTQQEANAAADGFIRSAFNANWFINSYAYFINIITLAPFIALMLMVATLLTYSVLKLRGVESISSLGAMIRIVGSFVWFSAVVSAILTLICTFFVRREMINALTLVLFFIALVLRSVIFAIIEGRTYTKQETVGTEA